jgi:hypothetical protein
VERFGESELGLLIEIEGPKRLQDCIDVGLVDDTPVSVDEMLKEIDNQASCCKSVNGCAPRGCA